MRDNSGKIILALLAGASAGVIAGLLMAPDTGEVTRETLRKTAARFGKDVEGKLQPLLDKLGDLNASGLLNSLTGGDEQGQSGSSTASGSGAASGSTGSSSSAGNAGNAGSSASSGSRVGGATTSSGSASSGGGAGSGGGVGA